MIDATARAHCPQDPGHRLVWQRARRETLWIEPWGVDRLRVRATVLPEMPLRDWSLIKPLTKDWSRSPLATPTARISNGGLLPPSTSRGRVRFFKDGATDPLLEEIASGQTIRHRRTFKFVGGDLSQATWHSRPGTMNAFYGLGQRRHGLLDQKGCVLELTHRNSEISIPFMLSSRGYPVSSGTIPGMGRVEFGRTRTTWVADATRLTDYVVTTGDGSEIIERYADLTGHPPMLPEWAAGFWQCKLRYQTQDELLAVAREHKRRGLPMSVIVIDYFHWTKMGDWKFDPECWPDPAAMVRELEEMGIKVMVSIWPTVNPDSENFAELDASADCWCGPSEVLNGLVKFTDTQCRSHGHVTCCDTTHPEARAFSGRRCGELFQHGIKTSGGWMPSSRR